MRYSFELQESVLMYDGLEEGLFGKRFTFPEKHPHFGFLPNELVTMRELEKELNTQFPLEMFQTVPLERGDPPFDHLKDERDRAAHYLIPDYDENSITLALFTLAEVQPMRYQMVFHGFWEIAGLSNTDSLPGIM